MSEHPCPCCDLELYFVGKKKYAEYLCTSCHHTFYKSSVQISAEDYSASDKYADYYAGKPPHLWYHKKALEAAKSLSMDAKILDFGCYDGFFTKRMLDEGLDAYGCDWNTAAIAAGGERFGISDRLSRDGEGVYDAVVALEVIEHFEDPNVFMQITSGLLKEGGRLILSCPNKDMVYRPSTDAPPHHFSRFSTNSLNTILTKYGFEVETHKVEYSFLQMTRNFLGDRMRFASTNIEDDPREEVRKVSSKTNSAAYKMMRQFANVAIPAAGLLAIPLDWGMRGLNMPYIAQFVVGRRS